MGDSKKINPSLITTPIGAIIGVALTRKLIPKEDLTTNKYIIGGALGAGAGLVAGEVAKGSTRAHTGRFSNLSNYKKFLRDSPGAPITPEERSFIDSQRPSWTHKGSDSTISKGGRTLIGAYGREAATENVKAARAQVFIELSREARNPTDKAKFLQLAQSPELAREGLSVLSGPFSSIRSKVWPF